MKSTRICTRLCVLGVLAFAPAAMPAFAQDFPKKQVIRIIVPQAAGSATDTIARVLAPAAFGTFMATEIEKWTQVARDANKID